VNRVSKGIKNRLNIPGDISFVMPNICHRKAKVFGKGSRPIDSDSFCVFTKVTPSSKAISTS
jgi:hypothetical protein